jgi:hypothetical protein
MPSVSLLPPNCTSRATVLSMGDDRVAVVPAVLREEVVPELD